MCPSSHNILVAKCRVRAEERNPRKSIVKGRQNLKELKKKRAMEKTQIIAGFHESNYEITKYAMLS